MLTFDESNPTSVAQFTSDNISRHSQFALGTVDEEKKPWVVCLHLAVDDTASIIWKSRKDSLHSRHIQTNPSVAICIFSEDSDNGVFGFYAKGIAHEVIDDTELQKCLMVRFTRKGKPCPPRTEFQDSSIARIYLAKLSVAWIVDHRHQKTMVDLDILRTIQQKRDGNI